MANTTAMPTRHLHFGQQYRGGILTIHVRYPTTITNIDVVIERDGKGELSPMR